MTRPLKTNRDGWLPVGCAGAAGLIAVASGLIFRSEHARKITDALIARDRQALADALYEAVLCAAPANDDGSGE